MTFTPTKFVPSKSGGLDEEFQRQQNLLKDDQTAQEEFDEAQKGLKTTGEVLYNLGKTGIFFITGGKLGALDAIDSLRNKIEGKPFKVPSTNPVAIDPATNLITSINPYEITSESGTEIVSQLKDKITSNSPITITSTGNVPNIVAQKDKYEGLEGEEVVKKYMEEQGIELTQDDGDPLLDLLTGAQIRTKRVNRKTIKNLLLQYPNISDDRVERYITLNERGVEDVAKTIKFLNNLYAQNTPSGEDLEDVAAEFSVIFGVDATVQDLQNIIEERGNLVFKTESMDQPFIIRNLEELQAAYFDRLNVLKKANVFDEGHIFAVNNLLRDKNVTNIATYRSNVEPEIARSIEQLIDKQTLEELISPGQGPAYIEKVVLGNRSRKDENDPDKAIARVFGAAYGVEEDFLNFMFPNQTVASKVPPDLKDTFVDLYNKELTALLQNFPKSKPGQGGLKLGIFTLQKLKDQIQNLVAEEMNLASGLAKALSETEYQRIKKQNPEILLYLDERFGGKEQYVVPDKPARRIRRKGIDTKGLNEFRIGSSWDIGE